MFPTALFFNQLDLLEEDMRRTLLPTQRAAQDSLPVPNPSPDIVDSVG